MLSSWEGRAGSLVTQYFSFLVQFGVGVRCCVSVVSVLCEALRVMEMILSAFGRRPCDGPRRCRVREALEGTRGAFCASRENEEEPSILSKAALA